MRERKCKLAPPKVASKNVSCVGLVEASIPFFNEFRDIILARKASADERVRLRENRASGAGRIGVQHGDFASHPVSCLDHHHAQLASSKDSNDGSVIFSEENVHGR